MLIDLTLPISADRGKAVFENFNPASLGHMGTHFDVMDKEFPLDFVKRDGIIFNVRGIYERDIKSSDIDITLIKPGIFVIFNSGYIEEFEYGSKEYSSGHPQLSQELIDLLLEKRVSIIGIDFAGIRNGSEHPLTDQYCADKGVFVVENMCNLNAVPGSEKHKKCIINTYPLRLTGFSGLPCRVIAEV